MDGPHRSRPPRFWAFVARVLIRGRYGDLIRADLDESFERDLERGTTPERARRRYLRNLLASAVSVWKARLAGGLTQGWLLDARLGARMLVKQPLLTGVALLALSLGIPATLSMIHVFDSILQPLPVPEGHRVMGVRHWDREIRDPVRSSIHDYARWREALGSFQSMAAARPTTVNLHAGDPRVAPVRGARVTSSTFDLLRSTPLLGRVFGPDDEARGAPDVVILREDLWEARFARDPEIVGRTVHVGGDPHTVVGVMPADFRFPLNDQVWLPLRARPVDYAAGKGPELFVFGRLADGVTREEADLEAKVVAERLAEGRPEADGLVGEVVEMPILLMEEDHFVKTDPEFLLMEGLVFAMLIIVCGNVGVLILARTATRAGELSVRTALGASRGRIVLQLFIEALVLALGATGLGLVLAELVAIRIMRLIDPFGFPVYWMDLGVTPRLAAKALGLAALSAVVAGVLPAFKATSRSVQSNLRRAAAGGSTPRFGLAPTLLIVTEVVLSVGFLGLGGVLVRSAFQDTDGRLGFEPERYLAGSLRVPWVDPAEHPEYGDEATFDLRLQETQRGVLARLEEHPDVIGASFGRHLPGDFGGARELRLEEPLAEHEGVAVGAHRLYVGWSFFRDLGRPILAGRDFTVADLGNEPDAHRPSVIVNTGFVEQILGGRQPLGRRLRFPQRGGDQAAEPASWFEIVGVVGPFGTNVINPTKDAAVYHPLAAGEVNPVQLVVETAVDPSLFAPRFREIAAGVDPEATLERVMPVAEIMQAEGTMLRMLFLAQVGLAAVAFLLSVTGLYALMAFTVARRTREIGIRAALGARPREIVASVARTAATQLGLGLVLGSVWAWILLDGARDTIVIPVNVPATVAFTVLLTGLVGVLACARPVLRGIRIQPTEALREV